MTCVCVYVCPCVCKFVLTVELNGEPIRGSPFTVDVIKTPKMVSYW